MLLGCTTEMIPKRCIKGGFLFISKFWLQGVEGGEIRTSGLHFIANCSPLEVDAG